MSFDMTRTFEGVDFGAGNGTKLEIHHINVGRGDSTLILIKKGLEVVRSILIDAGSKDSEVLTFLQEKFGKGPITLDCLIVSHFHSDHIGGIDYFFSKPFNSELIVNFKSYIDPGYYEVSVDGAIKYPTTPFNAGEILKNQDNKSNVLDAAGNPVYEINEKKYTEAIAYLLKHGGTESVMPTYTSYINKLISEYNAVRIPKEDKPEFLTIKIGSVNGKDVTLECVAGNCKIKNGNTLIYALKKGNDSQGQYVLPNNLNDTSLAFVLKCGEFKYLTSGDLSGNEDYPENSTLNLEIPLSNSLNKNGVSNISAMKINHHGSKYNTCNTYLKNLKPSNVVLFPFYLSACNLPTVEMLTRLQENNINNLYFTSGPFYVDKYKNAAKLIVEYTDFVKKQFQVFKESFSLLKDLCSHPTVKFTKVNDTTISTNIENIKNDDIKKIIIKSGCKTKTKGSGTLATFDYIVFKSKLDDLNDVSDLTFSYINGGNLKPAKDKIYLCFKTKRYVSTNGIYDRTPEKASPSESEETDEKTGYKVITSRCVKISNILFDYNSIGVGSEVKVNTEEYDFLGKFVAKGFDFDEMYLETFLEKYESTYFKSCNLKISLYNNIVICYEINHKSSIQKIIKGFMPKMNYTEENNDYKDLTSVMICYPPEVGNQSLYEIKACKYNANKRDSRATENNEGKKVALGDFRKKPRKKRKKRSFKFN